MHSESEAEALIGSASRIVACRGKKVVSFEMKDSPDLDEILQVVLGPTGNLRAPTLRAGNTLVVGFNDEAYRAALS